MDAGAWPHVNHMIGCADHVFIMLDNQHAVADVPQVFEGADQPVVVALVQSDAGLVKYIHNPGQARANLRRQTDALRLSA